jgi:hypothetical protein
MVLLVDHFRGYARHCDSNPRIGGLKLTLKKVILLNPTTIRIIASHTEGDSVTDVSYTTIVGMDATSFATWAKENINPPVAPVIPSWLADMVGQSI